MQRRSAIAVAGAVTGILIAGSIASVAVINAASSSTLTDEVPIVAASALEPESVQVIEPAPGIDQAPLPAIVVPEPIVVTEPIQVTAGSVKDRSAAPQANASAPEPNASAREPNPSAPEPNQSPSADATQAASGTITADQARQAATAATPGKVLSTVRVQHAGYDAFAVQIERTDGSVVTGYVEATSGVVFDWVIDKQAPAPAATYVDDDDYDDDRDDDDYDDYDDDDHEYDDHDDDRDDDDD